MWLMAGIVCTLCCYSIEGTPNHNACNEACRECLPGHFLNNGDCSSCPSGCGACTSQNNCSDCKSSYYYKEEIDEGFCYKCPYQCSECVSLSNCTACQTGYYGQTCQSQCYLCKGRQCSRDRCTHGCVKGYYQGFSGGCYKCSLCKDGVCSKNKCTLGCCNGYYSDARGRCQQCLRLCATCTQKQTCNRCVTGHWGDTCTKFCKGCKNELCHQQTGTCTDGCAMGWFRTYLNCSKCPIGCISCTSNSECEACELGRWGKECQSDCGRCKTCDKTTGACPYVCEDGYYLTDVGKCNICKSHCKTCKTISKCTSCTLGNYGEECQFKCPPKCTSCESDLNCTSCIEGRYGPKCQMACDSTCKSCMSSSTHCVQCFEGFFLQNASCARCFSKCSVCNGPTFTDCQECKSGFYLNSNKWLAGWPCRQCPVGCSVCTERYCRKCDPFCSDCFPGYYNYHNQCHPCPKHCINCTSQYECDRCEYGYNGVMCAEECPVDSYLYKHVCSNYLKNFKDNITCSQIDDKCGTVCLNSRTDITCYSSKQHSRKCFQCETFNETCLECHLITDNEICENKHCSDLQRVVICNGKDGTCFYGCPSGKWGPFCVYSCSDACAKKVCNRVNGYCDACSIGRYGDFCQYKCSDKCVFSYGNVPVCSKTNGSCTYRHVNNKTHHVKDIYYADNDDEYDTNDVMYVVIGLLLVVFVSVSIVAVVIWKRTRKRLGAPQQSRVTQDKQKIAKDIQILGCANMYEQIGDGAQTYIGQIPDATYLHVTFERDVDETDTKELQPDSTISNDTHIYEQIDKYVPTNSVHHCHASDAAYLHAIFEKDVSTNSVHPCHASNAAYLHAIFEKDVEDIDDTSTVARPISDDLHHGCDVTGIGEVSRHPDTTSTIYEYDDAISPRCEYLQKFGKCEQTYNE